jgi:hypothetical protein
MERDESFLYCDLMQRGVATRKQVPQGLKRSMLGAFASELKLFPLKKQGNSRSLALLGMTVRHYERG